jgi:hypothetical protein
MTTDHTTYHVWEKLEITLKAQGRYENPYTQVEVWVDLKGPGFNKRVYGFWDGGDIYRVRILATAPGEWAWVSGSNQGDAGLNGREGRFQALPWSEEELEANPNRRGFLRPTANGHALEYADGTPCYLLGDTWWALPTHRYRWYEDDVERPIGPEMGLKDMLRYRKAQGYNCIAMIAAFPNWANDGYPPRIEMGDGTTIRAAWRQWGTESAESMHNAGGRPFLFPGRVPGYEEIYPDVERINPAYFQVMDRKVDYLNSQGFIPFIEVARRDCSEAWKQYYPWPESYTRYIQYVWSRYGANHCILSPIHYDHGGQSIPSRDFNAPANSMVAKGVPAFGTLGSCNSSGSSLINFGNADEAPWLTLHQIGNRRHHNSHWLLTQIYYEAEPPRPAMNGEPYYPGFPQGTPVKPYTEEADLYARSGMYGSFLSGGFAGHIYGAAGLWPGKIEPEADYTMWEAIQWRSGAQMSHLRAFVWSEGARFQELIPNADWVYPSKNYDVNSNRGWAYCARTPEKDLYLIYFEATCPQATLRGALYERQYRAQWFDPRTGAWQPAGVLSSTPLCEIALPPTPDGLDWALKLVLLGPSSEV